MKILILLSALTLSSDAAVIIYNGTARQTVYGDGNTIRATSRTALILDADTGQGYGIAATSALGSKVFIVTPLQHYVIGTVNARVGQYSFLAKAESPGTQYTNTVLQSVYLRGKNVTVTVELGAQRTIPRLLSGSGDSVTFDPQTGQMSITESAAAFSLDAKGSLFANENALSLEDVLTIGTNALIKQGYSQITLPPAQ